MIKIEELRELLEQDRSYRRFDETAGIDLAQLKEIVGLTRFCASGRNLQPLKYTKELIFGYFCG